MNMDNEVSQNKTLVIATSDYCVMNILNLCDKGIIDMTNTILLIFDSFPIVNTVFENLRDKCCFYRVILARCKSKKSKYAFNRLIAHYINNRSIYTDISDIWIGSFGSLGILIYSSMVLLRNSNASILYYEEGYSSYLINVDSMSLNEGINKVIYNGIIRTFPQYAFPKAVWLYEPYLSRTKGIELKKIPKMEKECLERVYDLSYVALCGNKKWKIIYIGSYNARKELIDLSVEDRILSKINFSSLSSVVIYKKHPRSIINHCFQGLRSIDCALPWEKMLLSLDGSRKVIVSVMSTCSYSGNLLFGRNDILVYTYLFMLNRESEEYMGMNEFTKKLRDLGYEVYCPSRIKDLFSLMNELVSL